MIQLVKLPVKRGNASLRIAKGHFVTNHSHINYYVDITYQKTRLSEARDSAYQLVSSFVNDTPVDTVLCLDGTAVLGTCIAEELTKSGFRTINAHETVYVVEPEYNANSQIIFRENIQPMIRGKHVLVLMASVTTGFTAKRSIEAIEYYGGKVSGVAAIYRAVDEVEGYPVQGGQEGGRSGQQLRLFLFVNLHKPHRRGLFPAGASFCPKSGRGALSKFVPFFEKNPVIFGGNML